MTTVVLDPNRKPSMFGVSSVDGLTPTLAYFNPTTHGMLVDFSTATTAFGKTIKSKTGSASATFTLVTAHATNRLKVTAVNLITASTTAVTVTFKDGASGTALGTYPLQAITGTNFGVAYGVPAPSFLFATTAATLLELSFSAAQTVTYNVSYFDDDLT